MAKHKYKKGAVVYWADTQRDEWRVCKGRISGMQTSPAFGVEEYCIDSDYFPWIFHREEHELYSTEKEAKEIALKTVIAYHKSKISEGRLMIKDLQREELKRKNQIKELRKELKR